MRSLLSIVLISVAFLACSKSEEGGGMYLIPFPDEKGLEKLQYVNLPTLDDHTKMQGKVAQIYVSPYINGNQLELKAPTAKIAEVKKGYYIPQDTLSQEMLSVYAHIERLKILEEAVGLEGILNYPRKIGVASRVKSNVNSSKLEIDNASYLPLHDFILFYPFSSGQNLAMSLNGGIIAHEHFHALFYKLIEVELEQRGTILYNRKILPKDEKKKLNDQRRDIYVTENNNKFILRALNEGLADLWAVIYSNDSRFLTKSKRTYRNYNMPLELYKLNNFVPDWSLSSEYKDTAPAAYYLGFRIANVLQNKMQKDLGANPNAAFTNSFKVQEATYVVDKLYALKNMLIEKYEEGIEVEDILAVIYAGKKDIDDCQNIIKLAREDNIMVKACLEDYKDLDSSGNIKQKEVESNAEETIKSHSNAINDVDNKKQSAKAQQKLYFLKKSENIESSESEESEANK